MLGQDEVISNITALIQGRVGIFLQLRSQLLEMQRSPILTVSDEATQLLVSQSQLETDLPGAIEKSKTGNISDAISAGGFLVLMEKQIYDVDSLKNEYTGLGDSAKASLISGIPDWILYAGGAFILWQVIKKRRRK